MTFVLTMSGIALSKHALNSINGVYSNKISRIIFILLVQFVFQTEGML